MSRDAVWVNSDGLAVGFGTRTEATTYSSRIGDNGKTEKVHLTIKGTDLADAVATSEDQVIHGVVIPNGATILSATLKVSEAFTSGGAGVLDIGVYDKDGTIVDDDGIDAAVAIAALGLGAEVACDGADVNTVVATTGGVKICASYDTAAFTAGKATLEVEYKPA